MCVCVCVCVGDEGAGEVWDEEEDDEFLMMLERAAVGVTSGGRYSVYLLY